MTTPTVHNPTNFDPADYVIENYFDNRPPEYFPPDVCGMQIDLLNAQAMKDWRARTDAWEGSLTDSLGDDYEDKIHRCVHCGNSNVRWITAARHTPTGEVVVFGSDCTDRLRLAGRDEFKLSQLKKAAKAAAERVALQAKIDLFIKENPQVSDWKVDLEHDHATGGKVHGGNDFVHDVMAKLKRYGSLSDKQVAAVGKSLERDRAYAKKREAWKAEEAANPPGPAPEGRVEVTGKVFSRKYRETQFGGAWKITMKLENGSKVWMTEPSAMSDAMYVAHYDDDYEALKLGEGLIDYEDLRASYDDIGEITLKATFAVSEDDAGFGFGKRPTVSKEELGRVRGIALERAIQEATK